MRTKVSVFFVLVVVISSFVFLTAQTGGNTDPGKVTRKVISYNHYGNEYANEIDHVELEWSKTDGYWLPYVYADLTDITEYTPNPTQSYYMTQYNASNGVTSTMSLSGQVKLPGDYHTLKITIYQKNGSVGSLTFYGGYGELGTDMRWNVSYLGPDFAKDGHSYNQYRGSGSWNYDGSLFWTWADGNPVIPTYIYINNSVFMEGDPNGRNKIVFADLIRDASSPEITIELDGSFFPQ